MKIRALFIIHCSLFIACTARMLAEGNMTSFANQHGAINNNQYNLLMNPDRGPAMGSGGTAAANFGNCDALIQRCATPKCGNGGCTDMGIAVPIVAGCVERSEECKKHGDALIQAIAAQIVASNTAKASNQQAALAQQTAAMQAAQSSQQMEAINTQMQQMQQQMAMQQAESAAQMQAALAQQQAASEAMMAQAAAAQQASAPAASIGMTPVVQSLAEGGISADVIARQQIAGQVMSSLDGVNASLSSLKKTVQDVSEYAGCDRNATSCTGPKRIAAFRKKAENFFGTYDDVVDSLEDALLTAMAAGIDVTDIFMMLTNQCTTWAKYLCQGTNGAPFYYCVEGARPEIEFITDANDPRGQRGQEWLRNPPSECRSYDWHCTLGSSPKSACKKIPNPTCQSVGLFRNDDRSAVQQNWIQAYGEDQTNTRLACISDGLMQSGIFARSAKRKKANDFDIDALEMVILQDAPANAKSQPGGQHEAFGYCAVTNVGELRQRAMARKYVTNTTAIMTAESKKTQLEKDIATERARLVGIEETQRAAATRGDMETAGRLQRDITNINNNISRLNEELNTATADHTASVKGSVGAILVKDLGSQTKCNDTDDLETCYANQYYAMCSTHAYNVGKASNDEIEDRTDLNEVIALKATIIVQQLKKQNDYLASIVKQMKSQLQKAVMVANAEAAGAPSSSVQISNSAGGPVNCGGSRADVISCVSNNVQKLKSMSTSDFKKACENMKFALRGAGVKESDYDFKINKDEKGQNGKDICSFTSSNERDNAIYYISGVVQHLRDTETTMSRGGGMSK